MTRISSPPGVVPVRLRNADARLALSAVVSPRSKYDARFHVAEKTAPSLDGEPADSGPLRNRLPCAHESRRLIAGGDAVALPALNAGAEPVTSIARDHTLIAGRRGIRLTAMPGAPT